MSERYGRFEQLLADRYRFEEELGRGAMGTVYRAHDLRLDRAVAIKLLHPQLTNEIGARRFESEIRIAASLQHPHIIAVHESGNVDGALYYVMDYLGGETLRSRLVREKQLSIEDSLRIIGDVAAGLQHAHDRGIVHRDVKPENIILAGGLAYVLDFGLARALSDVDSERLTASGLSVGTPHYLSPEQAAAERDVGPKADQYALACVLFELLVGEPPFTGPTATAIAMRHIAEDPPHVRSRRRAATPGIDAAVHRALEKVPADRFSTVTTFAEACTAASIEGAFAPHPNNTREGRVAERSFARGRALVGIGGVALATAFAFFAWSPTQFIRNFTDRSAELYSGTVDSVRYLVLPPVRLATSAPDSALGLHLADALGHWSAVQIPTAAERDVATKGRNALQLTSAAAATLARTLSAGSYVMGEVASKSDSDRLTLDIFDVRGVREPDRISVTLPTAPAARDSVFEQLAFRIIFGRTAAQTVADAANGTRVRGAMNAYLAAQLALTSWNLPLADSALARAVRLDPAFSDATLALAQVRVWAHDATAQTTQLANRVLEDSVRISPTSRLHAEALRDLSIGEYAAACTIFEKLAAKQPQSFGAWFGIAECNRLDVAVIANRTTASGRAYRGSRNRGMVAIERAFDLIATVDSCCEARAIEAQRRHFGFTSTKHTRFGAGEGRDTTIYLSYPELNGDTLAFVPRHEGDLNRSPPRTHVDAVTYQRQSLLRIAAKRVAANVRSPDALELLGEALELAGDPAAIDTIRRARILATSESQAIRLATNEAWLRFKFAIPGNTAELRAVGALSDSLLAYRGKAATENASLLAGLAALRGDANKAALLSQNVDAGAGPFGVPKDVLVAARLMLVSAAVGAPLDSLQQQESRLVSSIQNGVPRAQQSMARTMLLGRAVSLAYPRYRANSLSTLQSNQGLIAAQMAHALGDTARAHQLLSMLTRTRAAVRPVDRTFDALYPEALLLAALGDTAAALNHIAPSLDALRQMPVRDFYDAVSAGSVVQTIMLRASLLARDASTLSKEWARAVVTLTDSTSAVARDARRRMWELAR